MLQIIKSNAPTNKNILVQQLLENQKTTLIVSDLQSKLYWQSITKGNVLRASEFWKILLNKNEPDIQILDDQSTLIRLQRELDQIPESVFSDLQIKKIKPKTFMGFFFELFPLFSHPQTAEIMQYWFEEQKQAAPVTWEPIFYLCKSIWHNLKQENILPERAISSYLLHTLNYEFAWKTPLVFDLGGNLQTTESELILTLSQQLNVSVIEPSPEWLKDFHWLVWPYKQLKTRSFQDLPAKVFESSIASSSENKYYRFTNPLSEVKMVMSQIHSWIKEGVPKSKIYISAPNIEDYWPALKWHLDSNNLNYSKEPRIKYIEILSLQKLISQLKCTYLRSSEKKDLEAALFINEDLPALKYAEFSQLYSEIYSPKDYFRNHKVSDKFNAAAVNMELSAEEFLQIVTELYPKSERYPSPENKTLEGQSLFEEFKTEFISCVPAHFKVEIHYWIYYLEHLLNKKEIPVSHSDESKETNNDVINIVPLPSVYALTDYKAIFLGLNETSLKSNSNVISGSDVMSLLNKTGHLLDHPDRNYFEFLLQWSQNSKNGHIYSFAETNWKTEEQTPSVFWLLGYTEMQTDSNPFILNNNPESILPTEDQIMRLPQFKNIKTSDIFKTLSPSGLEKLNDCAFKYYVERLLYLNEDRILDLDPSPLTLGSLFHKLCELLTIEPIRFSLEEPEWDSITDTTLQSAKTNELMPFQKIEIKNKLIAWGKIFLTNEKEWRQTHPDSRIYAREIKFSGSISDIKFNGKIDRMDWDQHNQFSIVDYKSSVTSLTGPLSWIKNNHLQILCYIYAAEKGWIDKLEKPNISGAYYLSLKNFDKKGFTSVDSKTSFLSPLSSKSELSAEVIAELLSDFEDILNKSIEKLKSGNIEPIPRDERICHDCSWRHLCRAPHLNM